MIIRNWISKIAEIGRAVIGKGEPKKPSINVKKHPLKTDQYYQGVFPKKYIILHHTAGGSATSSIAGWEATPDHIATPYVIDRDGTIYECYDPKYWAYSLGVKGGTDIEKAAIPIEICSYGQLKKNSEGKYIAYTGREISPEKVVATSFRGFEYWEAYTPEQIASLNLLLIYLMDRFKIEVQKEVEKFWEYRDPKTLPSGIWSHTTVRKDKVDIFPQKEIVDLVYGLQS